MLAQRLGKLKKGEYKFSAWVKLKGGHEESKFLAAIRFSGQRVVEGRIISSGLVNKNCWTKMEGGFSLREAQSVTLRLGGLLEGSSLMVAATSVQNVNSDDYLTNQNKIISQVHLVLISLFFVESFELLVFFSGLDSKEESESYSGRQKWGSYKRICSS